MNTSPDHIDELIASYLSGEASADESALLEAWIKSDASNRRYYEQMRTIFHKVSETPEQEFDTDLAWEKVRARVERPKGKTADIKQRWLDSAYIRIAASIIVLVTAGVFAYRFFNNDMRSVEVLSRQTTEADTLPDGSDVFLNKQTRIEYAYKKKEGVHVAKLEGEAYFKIEHDDHKTFIVEAEGTFIKDIGTSFNVKAYPESRTIEVVVEEGEVMFYTDSDPGIYLKANGKGIYNKDTGKFTVAEPEANVTAYKTRFFSFRGHSLEEVVNTLNSVYETQITIEDHLKSCRLTVSFNDENIDEIAQVTAETLGLSVSKKGNVIALEGKGCGEEHK